MELSITGCAFLFPVNTPLEMKVLWHYNSGLVITVKKSDLKP